MKTLFITSLVLLSVSLFSQTKIKDIDKDVNSKLDSLSKVYNLKVTGCTVMTRSGVRTTYIEYVKNHKTIKKTIKVEPASTKPNILSNISN